jgi:hypothetical protein
MQFDIHQPRRLCQNSEMKEQSSTDYADYTDFFAKGRYEPNRIKTTWTRS